MPCFPVGAEARMVIALGVAALVVLAFTAVLSVLSRALVQVSPSQLERHLEEIGTIDGGRWILGRLERVEWTVSFLRTFGRMAFFVLVLVMVNEIGKPLTVASLVVTGVVSGIMVWLFTGVVAGGFARYAPAEAIAKCMTLLRLSYAALYPVVQLASVAEDLVRRGVRADSSHVRQEEELLSSIEDTQRKGAIDDVSAAILENTLEFGDTTVGAVMTPRSAVKGLPYSDDLATIRSFIERAGYSRYPVYESSLDQVLGVLYVKDLVPYVGQGAEGFVLRPLLRAPMRVPESKPVRDVLGEFQRSQVHFAVVVNEYGGVSGVVTIEDVIEELVGEISDEHERFRGPDIKRIGENAVEVRGRYSIYDLNEALGCELPEDEGFETVAGLMLARLGHIPKAGERLESDGAEFEVLRATATTVEHVRVTRKPVENLEGE